MEPDLFMDSRRLTEDWIERAQRWLDFKLSQREQLLYIHAHTQKVKMKINYIFMDLKEDKR